MPVATPGGRFPTNPRPTQVNNSANRDSGAGAVGFGFLNGDLSDDSDDEDDMRPPAAAPARTLTPGVPMALRPQASPLQRPPGLSNSQGLVQPPPRTHDAMRPGVRQDSFTHDQSRGGIRPPNLTLRPPPPQAIGIPQPQVMSPMTPHPLDAPAMPIVPAFARPTFKNRLSTIKFSDGAIMRGTKEETLLSRNTEKGAEFWRRFSVVVKEPEGPNGEKTRSSWLEKTKSGSSRMNKCVWVASLVILLAIGAGVGFGWYFTHGTPASNPKVLGGSANNSNNVTSSTSPTSSLVTTTTFHHATVTGDLPPTTTPVATAITTPAVDPDTGLKKRRDGFTKRRYVSLPQDFVFPNVHHHRRRH